MPCRKCKRETPSDALYCPYCGLELNPAPKSHKGRTRPNGAGTAVKRGKTWTARVVVAWKTAEDGHAIPIWKTKGGFQTKRDALAYIPDLFTQPKKKPVQTLQAVYQAWLPQHEQRVSHSTINCYKAAWRHFSALYYYPIKDIDVDMWQECLDTCGCAKRTRENMKALCGLLYKYAIPRHQADMNLAEYLHTGENDKSTRPAFTMEHVESIRQQIGITQYAEYVYVLIYTGFRPTELFSLTKNSYQDGILYGGIKTEAGKNRAVPVSPRIEAIVDERLSISDNFLFPRDNGEQMTVNYFRDNYFYRVLDAAGIQPMPTDEHPAYYTPYSCRHTFANMLKYAQGSDKDKAALIGHEDYSTTKKHYQSAEIKALKEIISQLY